jgi:hypothetical protein
MKWWVDERDPGPRPGKVDWDRFDDVAARYPLIGHLTGDEENDDAVGSIIRGLLMLDLGIHGKKGGNRPDGVMGAVWPESTETRDIEQAYDALKDEMLTAAIRIRWDRSQG